MVVKFFSKNIRNSLPTRPFLIKFGRHVRIYKLCNILNYFLPTAIPFKKTVSPSSKTGRLQFSPRWISIHLDSPRSWELVNSTYNRITAFLVRKCSLLFVAQLWPTQLSSRRVYGSAIGELAGRLEPAASCRRVISNRSREERASGSTSRLRSSSVGLDESTSSCASVRVSRLCPEVPPLGRRGMNWRAGTVSLVSTCFVSGRLELFVHSSRR